MLDIARAADALGRAGLTEVVDRLIAFAWRDFTVSLAAPGVIVIPDVIINRLSALATQRGRGDNEDAGGLRAWWLQLLSHELWHLYPALVTLPTNHDQHAQTLVNTLRAMHPHVPDQP